MRVLVTGATGLVGRALVQQLCERSHEVVAIVREDAGPSLPESVTVVGCDLARRVPLPEALGSLDAVVHLAQSRRYRDFPGSAAEVLSVAATAAVGLATVALQCGARKFVLASSGGVYAHKGTPLKESDPLGSAGELGYYLTVKRVTEQLMEQFRPSIDVSALRYFFVYGPGQAQQMFVARLVTSVRAGTPVLLPGGRGPRVNPVFVSDAAAATVATVESAGPATLNVAGPEVADVREICETIGDLVGRKPVFEVTEDRAADLVADTTLLSSIAPPRVGLRAGLEMLNHAS